MSISALDVPGVVNAAHHGLVGGGHRPGGKISPILAEVGEAQVRQQVHKRPLGLGHQAGAVRQEQHVFTQSRRNNTSTREMIVRVLPEPVAITSSAFRRFSVSKAWQTAFTVSTW